MAVLREKTGGRAVVLEADHLVGRSPRCRLHLDHGYVSSQHATIRWAADGWEIKDLGSRNGTFLDGTPLKPGQGYPLRKGAVVAFGPSDQPWELEDESAPQVMAVPLDEGPAVLIEGEILAVPSSDDPRVTIYRGSDGRWRLERPEDVTTVVENQQTFTLDGRPWRFCCPDVVARTSTTDQPREVRTLHLQFAVSRDEEHVELRVSCAGQEVDLGSRAHNYLLLTLARYRLGDDERGLPDTTAGWVYQEDLLKALGTTSGQLNIDVFRIRKQFSLLGLADAADIIERRPRTKQLRIGASHIAVKTL